MYGRFAHLKGRAIRVDISWVADGNRTGRELTDRRAGGARRVRRATIAAVITLGSGIAPTLVAPHAAEAGPDDIVLSGRVWRDDDRDATIDADEYGLAGITVRAAPQSGSSTSTTTRADGTWSVTVNRTAGPDWRIVVEATSTYQAAPLTNQNATTVQVVSIPTTSSGTIAVGDTALVDPRFLPAPIECYSGYVGNYPDDTIRRFGPPDATTGLGAPLQPASGGTGATAWARSGQDWEDPMAMVIGPEGNLWMGEETEDEVGRFNANTGAYLDDVEPWNAQDVRGVTFGLDGRLYVSDNTRRRVYWYEPASGSSGTFANTNEFNLGGSDNRTPEQGIAWRNGLFYVATGPAPGKVLELSAAGSYTGRSWTLDEIARGMHVGPDGLLYVATGNQTTTGALWRIDPDADTATRLLTGPSFFDAVFGPDSSLFLVENVSGRIRRYAWPALTAMADYLPASGTSGYTHSQPRSLIWWRGTNSCPSEVRTYEIGDLVWSDVDADGVRDPSEPGIPTVTVGLYETGPDNAFGTADDVLAASTTTDHEGRYRFAARPEGVRYEIRFSGGVLGWATLTSADTGGNDRLDSDAVTVASRHRIEVTTGAAMAEGHSLDVGFRLATLSLSGVVFDDVDNDGILDADEGAALPGTDVEVLDASGTIVQLARTDDSGRYTAIGLTNGDYRVRVPASVTGSGATWRSSTGTPGASTGPFEPAPDPDDDLAGRDDAALDVATGHTDTGRVTLTANAEPTSDGDGANGNRTVDLGFFRPATIGDRVWSDDDRDGVQDVGEGVVLGTVTVELRNAAGTAVATTTTAADGTFRFSAVSAGTYTLRVVAPAGLGVAPRDVGSDTTDSDIDADGITAPLVITAASATSDIDAGLLGATLGDRVFVDKNDNGTRDALEIGFAGVPVQLVDEVGTTVLNNTTTADDGTFRFRGLPSGSYRLRIPFDAVYQGVANGYVSSVGFVANHGATTVEPAADPDDDTDDDDDGSADWTSGDVTTEPISVTIGAEPTAEDGDAYTNLTADFGLHQPEGLAVGDGYLASVMADAPIGYWRLGDASTSSVASDESGNGRHGTYVGAVTKEQPGAVSGDVNTSVSFGGNGSNQRVNLSSLPVDTAAGAKTTVEFWMYWTGGNNQMPFGWQRHDLWIQGGRFGFNSACGDVYGVPTTGLANRWVHVTAVFNNGNTAGAKLYIDGTQQNLAGTISCNGSVTANASIAIWGNDNNYTYGGRIDELAIYNGELPADTIAQHYTAASGLQPPPGNTFTISTYAGNGSSASSGDGGPATSAGARTPSALDVAPDGTVYFTDWGKLRKVTPAGVISTVGTVDANWNGVAVGPDGFIYVAEYGSCVIRRFAADGSSASIWAGASGTCSTSGDGGPYSAARFNRPMDLVFDSTGNLYISEYSAARIRKVAAGTGIVTTFATGVSNPWGLAVDGSDNIWLGRWNTLTNNLYRFTPAGTATSWSLSHYVMGLDVRADGAVFTASYSHCSIRRLYNGVQTSVTENPCGFAGDGGSASSARVNHPTDIAFSGNTMYVTDRSNYRVRKLQ